MGKERIGGVAVTITYLLWKDAVSEEASEPGPATARLALLHAVGFLADETEDAVAVRLEQNETGELSAGRWILSVPKNRIIERRDVPLSRFGRKRK